MGEAFVAFLIPFFLIVLSLLFLQRFLSILEANDTFEILSVFAATGISGAIALRVLRGSRIDPSEVATIIDARIRAAARIPELEDEGVGFYLEVEDNAVVFLQGQYLDELDDERRFPTERVRYVYERRTGTMLELDLTGAYVEPRAVLRAFSRRAYRDGSVPVDGQVIQASFDHVLEEHASLAD